jgi:hypothetical protein
MLLWFLAIMIFFGLVNKPPGVFVYADVVWIATKISQVEVPVTERFVEDIGE